MRQRIAKIRRFVKERGYSHSYVATAVFGGDISRSYVSKLLSNSLSGLADDTLASMIDRMEKWVDSHVEKEFHLYRTVYHAMEGYGSTVQRAVLKQLMSDL